MNDDSNPLRPIGCGKVTQGPSKWFKFAARCSECADSGAVLAHVIGEPGSPYAFLCDCQAGSRVRRAYPLWSSADKNVYQKTAWRP